jgi:hypothetical protein
VRSIDVRITSDFIELGIECDVFKRLRFGRRYFSRQLSGGGSCSKRELIQTSPDQLRRLSSPLVVLRVVVVLTVVVGFGVVVVVVVVVGILISTLRLIDG